DRTFRLVQGLCTRHLHVRSCCDAQSESARGHSRQIEPPPGPSGPPQKAETPSVYRDFSTGPKPASRAAISGTLPYVNAGNRCSFIAELQAGPAVVPLTRSAHAEPCVSLTYLAGSTP